MVIPFDILRRGAEGKTKKITDLQSTVVGPSLLKAMLDLAGCLQNPCRKNNVGRALPQKIERENMPPKGYQME